MAVPNTIGSLPKDVALKDVLPDVTDARYSGVYGVEGMSNPDTAARETQIGQDLQKLREHGESLLSGVLPADVTEAVRKATAAGALARGISPESQLGRNLTVRDLGATSLDLKQQGATVLGTVAQQEEARQQFRLGYELERGKLREDIRRGDLSVAELAQRRYEFSTNTALEINKMLTTLGMFREEILFKIASTKLQGKVEHAAGPVNSITKLMNQITASYKG